MTQTTVDAAAMSAERELRRRFRGAVIVPGDERYDTERQSWHRTIDPMPAFVAEAAALDDLQTAVRVAGDNGLPLAIQSTGHGTLVPADGALLLRTSLLAGVEVDPARRSARVEPGAQWADVIAAAAKYGLAPLSGTPAIGVVGYTLGGGAGWLSRMHGFAADSVIAADVVTADGELHTVSAEQHVDLFWALRGGGGSFAAVAALEFRLYPVEEVLTGMAMYPLDRAYGIFNAYRDWADGEPNELNTGVMVMQLPSMPQLPEEIRGQRVVSVRAFGVGPNAERSLEPLTAVAGEPLTGGFERKSFAAAAKADGGPPPPMAMRQHFDLVREVPQGLLDGIRELADPQLTPGLMGLELRHWGGAMADPPHDHGPVGHREVPFSIMAMATDDPGEDESPDVAAVAARVGPYTTGGSFLNFETDPDRTASAYTADDYRRLREVKQTWDPDNLFGPTHNIAPAGTRDDSMEER